MAKTATLTAELLQDMTNTIVGEVDPDTVILFGSQARGEANQQSDVDLLIVENKPFGVNRSRRKEAAKVWRALARFKLPIDILLYSADEVAEWSQTKNHVIARAIREGQVIYEKSGSR
ncbi:nucleotidyltransferase domain-containing protein [Leptolyngbya sp. PCC 6406]|uniref:nucleotidyltransferase domain-containing protein n=1 Tax=Leptolyngbya sp. PCC 6406 TaxID=1173264 RepID=UPI0002ABA6F2|nr:nucleotidyltransferase domain-containing protein [Leptolyngbya sp. PCC 6406]